MNSHTSNLGKPVLFFKCCGTVHLMFTLSCLLDIFWVCLSIIRVFSESAEGFQFPAAKTQFPGAPEVYTEGKQSTYLDLGGLVQTFKCSDHVCVFSVLQ